VLVVAVEDRYLEKVRELFLERGIRAMLWSDGWSDSTEVLIVPREHFPEGAFLIELEEVRE